MRSYCVGRADNQIHASPERGGGSAQAEPEGSIRVESKEWRVEILSRLRGDSTHGSPERGSVILKDD